MHFLSTRLVIYMDSANIRVLCERRPVLGLEANRPDKAISMEPVLMELAVVYDFCVMDSKFETASLEEACSLCTLTRAHRLAVMTMRQ